MMRNLAVALLALTTCDEPQPTLELGSDGCTAVALEVRDPAVLPGWNVVALAAERVGGDSAWALARDPEGRPTLKAWPTGPGFDLSGLGPIGQFRLLPGLAPGQTWMTQEPPGKLRVWRLGAAAEGAGVEAPDLGAFPGPGAWSRRLLLVDGLPHLLAAPRIEDGDVVTLYVAALDPETLALGTIWPVDFRRPCVALDIPGCIHESGGAAVEILDVAEAGSVGGAVALLAIRLPGFDALSTMLELHTREAGTAPSTLRRDGFFIPGNQSSWPDTGLRGQLAADAGALYTLVGTDVFDEASYLHYMALRDTGYEYLNYAQDYRAWDGPLVQLGKRAVLGWFTEDGRFSLAPLRFGSLETDVTAHISLASTTHVSSAGREQLLVRPATGPAMRVVASCAARP